MNVFDRWVVVLVVSEGEVFYGKSGKFESFLRIVVVVYVVCNGEELCWWNYGG